MAAETHELVWDVDSNIPAAFLANDEVDRAIIFVHGWGGAVETTWDGFEKTSSLATLSGADLFFFEYDSKHKPFASSASLLRDSVNELLTQRGYSKLTFAGHSLGGVVIRRAVLDEVKARSAASNPSNAGDSIWASSSLKLFAPAQGGVQPSGLLGLIALGLIGVAKPWYVTVGELDDGRLLTQLQTQTTVLAEREPTTVSLRAKSMWASQETVIVSGFEYLYDPPGVHVPDQNHRSVCKPVDGTFSLPVDFLL